MSKLSALIFVLTYAGVALGRLPGLALDRTGIALLGAIGMIVAGIVSFEQAVSAIDLPTILLLYALMIISAQLRLGGFYTWAALRMISFLKHPKLFLLLSMLTSAVLSAILANDIICLAFTPVLTVSLLKAGLNPLPFLLGLAISSNIGSAATVIGNPQNMLVGQIGKIPFGSFLLWAIFPVIVSLAFAYLIIYRQYKGNFYRVVTSQSQEGHWPDFNGWQSFKGLSATALMIILFFTSIPRELSAIAIAGILLCSRKMKSRHILGLVDWHLITLFCALFVVIQGISLSNIPTSIVATLNRHGIDFGNLFMLTGLSAVLSNLVSNVPATMLLIHFLDLSNPQEWYTLALSSTFAGNFFVIGSIANIIVIEQAKQFGVEITFREHAKTGIPVTLCSLLILFVWIAA